MIQAYAGEFTVSPIPLEMSMNYCSHKCAYCFANLNQPNRSLDVNKAINQIKNCHTSKSLTSYLLANKYPILLSNRVDPFATTNYRQTLSFIEIFNQNENKIVFQTKGGKGVNDALSLLGYKTNFYISISFYDDKFRQLIEPGAPSVQDRFDLIELLQKNGHHVSVGINPIVEEWLPTNDFELLVEKLKSLNVKNVWIEGLHLNNKQISNMSEKEKLNIGKNIIDYSTKRIRNSNYFMYCHNYLLYNDFNVYSINQPIKSNFFDFYKKFNSIKTHQDFINYCFEKYPNGGKVKFGEYYNFMKSDFYEKNYSEVDGYAYRIARNVYKRVLDKPLKKIKDVLAFYWENQDVSKSLLNNGLFSVLSYKEKNKDFEYICKEDGMAVYWFHGYNAMKNRHYID